MHGLPGLGFRGDAPGRLPLRRSLLWGALGQVPDEYGRIPGPMIRVRVGDTVDFFLKNDATSSMPHNVDFHAVNGPGGGAMRLDTLPGSESELRFKTVVESVREVVFQTDAAGHFLRRVECRCIEDRTRLPLQFARRVAEHRSKTGIGEEILGKSGRPEEKGQANDDK